MAGITYPISKPAARQAIEMTSDPRDRISSLLHLASDAREFSETFVDYSKTPEQVYCKTSDTFMEQGHIDVLVYCKFPKRLESVPTWIVDWSMNVRDPCAWLPWHAQFNASGYTTSQQLISHPEMGHITLCGVWVGTIQGYGSTWSPNWMRSLPRTAAAIPPHRRPSAVQRSRHENTSTRRPLIQSGFLPQTARDTPVS